MDIFLQDARYGLRKLVKHPTFTLVCVLCLGLGIGANSAIFSVVKAAFLKPLPFADPDRLYVVYDSRRGEDGKIATHRATPPNFVAWREQNRQFEALAGGEFRYTTITGQGEPLRVKSAAVTADWFTTLGVEPLLGRDFEPAEDRPGASADVAILGHGLWQRQFGGDPSWIGRTATLNGRSHTLVGVMPRDFRFPEGTGIPNGVELWTPLGLDPDKMPQRLWHTLIVIGRLGAETTLAQARSEMSVLAEGLAEQFPSTNAGWGVEIVSLHEDLVQPISPVLSLLLAAVGFVLLIACANVANLVFARSMGRNGEFAVRLAVGSSRGRLVRQLLTESVILGLTGGLLGLALAFWTLPVLVSLVPSDSSVFDHVRIDLSVLGFTLVLSVLTGIFFGLAPALTTSRSETSHLLRQGSGRLAGGRFGRRLLASLVVVEVALALVLLAGAGLVLRSLENLRQVDSGFDTDNVLVGATYFSTSRYPEGHRRISLLEGAMEKIRSLPEVEDVAVTTTLPLGDSGFKVRLSIENRVGEEGELLAANHRLVSENYLRMMGIPLVSGRHFTARDDARGTRVVIVSQEMARLYWPNQDPLGRRAKRGGPDSESPWLTVVGVAADVKDGGAAAPVEPTWYLPWKQEDFISYKLAVRTRTDPMATVDALRRSLWSLDPDQPLFDLRTVEDLRSANVAQPRFTAVLLGLFGGLALVLVAVGIFGVMSYTVTQRLREIGVRIAFGASSLEVLGLVLKQGLVLSFYGLLLGLAIAFASTRLLFNQLFQVEPTDPGVLAGTVLILVGVALVAVLFPAFRAARVDPLVILKYE